MKLHRDLKAFFCTRNEELHRNLFFGTSAAYVSCLRGLFIDPKISDKAVIGKLIKQDMVSTECGKTYYKLTRYIREAL